MQHNIDALLKRGRLIFAFAMLALAVETIICAGVPAKGALPVIPFLPPIPWLAYLFGAVWAACALCLFSTSSALRYGSLILGAMLILSDLVFNLPRGVALPGNMSIRTAIFETTALASLAWMLPGASSPRALYAVSRYLLAVSLVVFGVDHFLALGPIAALIPGWIPFHVFWIGFFGAAFVASGLAFALNVLVRPAAALLGCMYLLWVVTLHLPRTLGAYGIPGAIHDPAEWSSLFIAVALWGGPWAIAAPRTDR